jgi:hypothetical protein
MNKICTTGNFVLRANIIKLAQPDDFFHINFNTQLVGARFPDERRNAYSSFLNRTQLTKLRDLIDLALLETT